MATINGVNLDAATGRLIVGAGATGCFRIDIADSTHTLINTTNDRGVFSFGSKSNSTTGYTVVLQKDYLWQSTDSGYCCVVEFVNSMTRSIPVGKYYWNFALVTDAEYDDEGHVIVEDNTDKVQYMYVDRLPQITIGGVSRVI